MDAAKLDIGQGEKVEGELDVFISRRHAKRVEEQGERDAEAMWAESVRRHDAQMREQNRIAWSEHFERMRALHRGLAGEYDEKLKILEQTA